MKLLIKDEAFAAKALGLKKFISVNPCKLGHTLRSTAAKGHCVQCRHDNFLKLPIEVLEKRRQKAIVKYKNRSNERRLQDNKRANQWRKDNPEKTHNWVVGWQHSHPVEMQIIQNRYKENKLKLICERVESP